MANLAAWILLLGLLYNQLTDFDVKSDNPIPPCYDAYNPPPSSSTHRLTAYNADTHLYKDAIPKLGMGHITLAGTRHHGLLNFEVWLQSLAPGVSTPIHSHPAPCEEINYVLEGKGIARTVDKDGRVVDIEIGVNSTVIAPPETIWQVENTSRDELLRVLVVIGCTVPGIRVYDNWNVTSGSSRVLPALISPMPWNVECPPEEYTLTAREK